MSSKQQGTSSSKAAPADAPVYHLEPERQVALLAQALLREYMHRKGFKKALTKFDEEHPRDADTISSRAVMYDLMHLATTMPEMRTRGIETIMEALCCMRVEKREEAAAVAQLRQELDEAKAQQRSLEAELASLEHQTAELEARRAAAAAAAASGGGSPTKADKAAKKKKKDKSQASEGGDVDGAAKEKKEKKSKSSGSKKASKVTSGPTANDDAKPAKTKKKKAGAKLMSIEELLSRDDDLEQARRNDEERRALASSTGPPRGATPSTTDTTPVKSSSAAGGRQLAAATGGDDKRPGGVAAAVRSGSSGNFEAASSSSSSDASSDGGKDGGDSDDDDSDAYGAALRKVRAEQARALGSDEPQSSSWAHKTPAAMEAEQQQQQQARPTVAPRVNAAAAGSVPLGDEAAAELLVALVGDKRTIPAAFLSEAWVRAPSTRRGAPAYALEQHSGGPCGIMAVVQARLIQHFLSPKSDVKGDFDQSLLRALASTIALSAAPAVGPDRGGARGNPRSSSSSQHQVVVVLPPEEPPASAPTTLKKQRDWLAAFRKVSLPATTSASAIASALRPYLDQWTHKGSPGVLCLVLSCILTRGGPSEVVGDMDVAAPLIVEHGYCSQEVTNLCLCGAGWSNAHDGDEDVGGMILRGYKAPLDVGFLSSMEVKGLMRVGGSAKHPSAAAATTGVITWVIYNESHYSVLFSVASGPDALRPRRLPDGSSRFEGFPDPRDVDSGVVKTDLYYFDQQGQQDEEIRLTLAVDNLPVPAQRQDVLVPFINSMVRTIPQWATAKVNWNGTDPLL